MTTNIQERKAPRQIAKLVAGDEVVLRFALRNGEVVDEIHRVVFVGEDASGDDIAKFQPQRQDGTFENTFIWEAYRFQGRWSYGSSAQRLSVVAWAPKAVV